MEGFGRRLGERARQLTLSNAEVARRAGLNERRYGHYVSGAREPDLQTLVRICRVLATTPNELLGFEGNGQGRAKGSHDNRRREAMREQVIAASNALDIDNLRLAVRQLGALLKHQRERKAGK